VYDLYTVGVPQGIYLSTARQGDRDVLTEGVIISTEASSLGFMFRRNPATVRGTVRDSQGTPVENALVGLLPEPPLDTAKLQSVRRSTRTDHHGLFELRGVIPGNYRAYAWTGVSSDAYLDQDFVKGFLTEGSPVEVREKQETLITLRLLKIPD
jgi:hypothetical protein